MERGVKHRPRRRSPLPFLLLAVAVVGCAFAVAVAAVVPMEADSHGGQDQALPTPTLEEAERDKLDAPAAATPTPTPAPYIPDEAEVEMLARLIWGEARGIPSDMHKAAVVWCALNRFIYHKAEIRFIRGRLRFTDDDGNAADPAPFPSMLVIYNGKAVKS